MKRILLVLALAVAPAALAQLPANAPAPLQHLDPESMSAPDNAALQAHGAEIFESAKIYGYNLEAGNWAYQQTLCAAMPNTILIHYLQQFPDGAESLFTALIPRDAGRVRIVPVLYRNATPFTPAPGNPRNFVLFNLLVPKSIAGESVMPNGNWLDLGMCYAEMTGAPMNSPPNPASMPAPLQVPAPVAHLDPQDNTTRVTLASWQGEQSYRFWSIDFNREGRVIEAESERYPSLTEKAVPPAPPATAAEAMSPENPPEATATTDMEQPESASSAKAEAGTSGSVGDNAAPVNTATQDVGAAAQNPTPKNSSKPQPGWRLIPPGPPPVWKQIPPAPPPPQKIVPTSQSHTPNE
jgi:hypothetical protein